jgi:hypothetical protein
MTLFCKIKMTLNNVNKAAMPLIQVGLLLATLNYSLVGKDRVVRVC